MCQNGPGSGFRHWIDSGPIGAQCGLSAWIWLNHANTQFTHLGHICDKKLIHCSKWLVECYSLSVTRTSVIKNTVIRKRFTFKKSWQVEMYCNRNPDVHWTMSITPKIDKCHNANFVIIVLTSWHDNDNLQSLRWWQRWLHDDSRFSVQWHTKYLTNVLWYFSIIYDNLLSDLFHHT